MFIGTNSTSTLFISILILIMGAIFVYAGINSKKFHGIKLKGQPANKDVDPIVGKILFIGIGIVFSAIGLLSLALMAIRAFSS